MKRIPFLLWFLLAVVFLTAKPIEMTTAVQVAENLMLERSGRTYDNSTASQLVTSSGRTGIYVIKLDPSGFVLVAGDDAANPVLGYSETGIWGEYSLPLQLEAQLQNWLAQLDFIISRGLAADNATREQWQRYALPEDQFVVQRDIRAVSPLISSTWGQESPYNALCPTGTPVGCVATAMSQIMRYWAYPTTGSGTHSYVHPTYGTQSADFGNTVYAWSSMPNAASSANLAVATICRHAGVSVDMDYATDGSGAYSFDVPNALTTYFKYKSTVSWKQKASYSESNWEALLRGELDNYRPVYYSGSSTESGGHAFIFDGYSGTNYFHINWGWYGYYNGYFYLSALNPGSYDFTSSQQAVIGIQPQEQFTDLTEGFEGAAFPPTGWNRSTAAWTRTTSSYITGTASARYSGTANNVKLITPKLTIAATDTLTFKAKRSTINRYEIIDIQYSPDGLTWYPYYTTPALATTATLYTVPFTTLTPGDYYLCFNANSTTSNSNNKTIYLDDVNGPRLWVDPNPVANLNLTSWAAGSVTPGNTGSSGAIFTLTNIGQGTLTVTSVTDLSTTEFSSTLNTNVALVAGQSHEFGFNYDPIDYGTDNQSYVITTSGGTVTITLSGSAAYTLYADGFEPYTDFTLDISPWTQYDGDGSGTYGITDVVWANSGYTGSFMVFDPTATVPALSGAEAHGGSQYAACFAATTPPNNDWLITRQLSFTTTPRISFWARSYVADYGLERFKVLVSTTGPAYSNFTTYLAGSATTYVEAPVTWTQYTYNLPANCVNNASVWIAIQCVSNDAFFFMVDDFQALDDSTPTPPLLGHLNGYVYRYGTSEPVANALVQIGSKSDYTDMNGYYSISNVLAGTYSVTASTPGAFYFNSTVAGVVISDDVTTSQNFQMTWAELSVNQTAFTSNLYLGQSETQTLAISNPGGTANLIYSLALAPDQTAGTTAGAHPTKRIVQPAISHPVPKLALPESSKDTVSGLISYGDAADAAVYTAAVTERATKFTISDFGLWSDSGLVISQLQAYFYNPSTDLWGTEDTFVFKIYAANGTTVLHTSAAITAVAQTTTFNVTSYTLPTPLTVSTDFWVSIVPEGTTSGKPYSLATEYDYGSSFYGSAGAWTAAGGEHIIAANVSGNRWISTSQSSGAVAPAGVSNVALDFDTTDLSEGTYSAFLTVYNNSNYIAPSGTPRGDNLVIPITLNVSVSTTPLGWINSDYWSGVAAVNGSISSGSVFQLKNIGTGTLTITSATLTGTAFTTTFNSSVTLAANATHDFGFTFSPLVRGVQSATFTVQTNGGTFVINLKGYGAYQTIDFESGTTLPTGWTSLDSDADTHNWEILANATYAHGGTNCATSASYVPDKSGAKGGGRGALTPDNWLISPRLRIQSGDELAYYIGALDPSWPAEKYAVMISTTDAAPASFTTALFTETLADGAWHLRSLSLSAYAGLDIFVAFRHYDCTDQYLLRLDDILMPPLSPDSPLPATMPYPAADATVYSFTAGTVTLSWQANPSGIAASSYKVYFDNTLVSPSQTLTTWTTPTLSAGLHTWQIVPISGSKTTPIRGLRSSGQLTRGEAVDCPVWSFTYTPEVIIPDEPETLFPDVVVQHDAAVPLQYDLSVELPAGMPPTFTPQNSFSLSGSGTVNITISSLANAGMYHAAGIWHAMTPLDGIFTLNVSLDFKGELIIALGEGDNTLPVELSYFSASINAFNNVLLMWVTESESNCLGYYIYRNSSNDLSGALNLQTLVEATNTSQQQTYVFEDKELNEEGMYYYWLQSLDLDGSNSFYGPISIDYTGTNGNGSPGIPLATELSGAYPNPFNPSTTINYSLLEAGPVLLEIYNLRGQRVKAFSVDHAQPGYYRVIWDGLDDQGMALGSGIYLYRMTAGKYHAVKRMTLVK